MLKQGRVAIWLFLMGAIPGTLCSALQVLNKVVTYSSPVLAGIAWWVPLFMGGSALLIGYTHAMFDPLIWHRRSFRPLVMSLGEQSWLLLGYVITLLPLYSVSKFGLLLVIYLNFWLLVGKSWQILVFSLITAITGTLIAMILVAAGAIIYTQADLSGVPYWLPFLYAIASLALGDLGRTVITIYTRGAS